MLRLVRAYCSIPLCISIPCRELGLQAGDVGGITFDPVGGKVEGGWRAAANCDGPQAIGDSATRMEARMQAYGGPG
jgi:hypothetical protein